MPTAETVLTNFGIQQGTEEYASLQESAESIVNSPPRYNKQDLWLLKILKTLENHPYELCGGGTNINGKYYSKTAGILHTKINDYLQGIASKSHGSKLKWQAALIDEIKQALLNKDHETSGLWFFGLGKRMPSTVLLYKKILQDIKKIDKIEVKPEIKASKRASYISWCSYLYNFFRDRDFANFKAAIISYTKTCEEQEAYFTGLQPVIESYGARGESLSHALRNLRGNITKGNESTSAHLPSNKQLPEILIEIDRLVQSYPILPNNVKSARVILETEKERILHHAKIQELIEAYLKEQAEAMVAVDGFIQEHESLLNSP